MTQFLPMRTPLSMMAFSMMVFSPMPILGVSWTLHSRMDSSGS